MADDRLAAAAEQGATARRGQSGRSGGKRDRGAAGERAREGKVKSPVGSRPPRARTRARRARSVEPDGPHVRLGVGWAGITLLATVGGPVWSALWLAPVAALAAATALRSWPAPARGDKSAPVPQLPVLAAAAAGVVVLASAVDLYAALAVGVLVVIGVVVVEARWPAAGPGPVRLGLLTLLPAAAASGLVLARAQGLSDGIVLVAMVAAYDSAAYLIGTGARFALEGPIAGLASIGALTLFIAAVPPFGGTTPSTPWILGGLAAVLAPLGPIVASRLVATPSARVPALRRLDSLLLLGPAWAAASALLLHT